MKRYYISVMALILILTFTTGSVLAHPGNTASDGCHYCRTNCDSWGVAWNERHCHGSNTAADVIPPVEEKPPAAALPTKIVIPTEKFIVFPTRIPTKKPTSTPKPTVLPSATVAPSKKPTITKKPIKKNKKKEVKQVQKKSGLFSNFFKLIGL